MAKSFRDRFFLIRLTRDEQKMSIAMWTIGMLLILLLASMGYLFFLIQKYQKQSSVSVSTSPAPPSAFLSPTLSASPPTPTLVPPRLQPQQQVESSVKEYFIPFGAGTSSANDWTDVPGLTAQIDFGNYQHVKEIHFEASIGIPTANETASVRLFNETDKHPVWYSEIMLTNGQFVSSSPIVYDIGSKTYQVQMKTSLSYAANLIQSRLHIILQ